MVYAAASKRTLANAAGIEGFFATVWFGWGQEDPPGWVWIVLVVGAVLAALVAVGGFVIAYRARGEPSPLSGPGTGRRYGIIVGTEFGVIGVGAAILGATGFAPFIAAWICLVVGVHFLPLARVFPGTGMAGLGIMVALVGVAAFIVGAATSLLPSTIAGLGAGACLLGHGALLLAGATGRIC